MKPNKDALNELLDNSRRICRAAPMNFKRYLANEINWDDRLICIKGTRGTGKTTLMLQRMREIIKKDPTTAVYMSLDSLFFSQYDAMDTVKYLATQGIRHIFLDEVHYYGKDWQRLVKNIYDQFPELKVAYTGSSLLKIEGARIDLSRRQAVYNLRGLSFREFLVFEKLLDYPSKSLEDILASHIKITDEILDQVRPLPHFRRYLERGYYPFYKDVKSQYHERLSNMTANILEVDYPATDNVTWETIRTTKKMLRVLAQSTPQTPNMAELFREIGTERNQGLKMLNALQRAALLALLQSSNPKIKNLSKPEKIYCDNTNLCHALAPRVDIGVERETFFHNQLGQDHEVFFSGQGDFFVDGRYTFEVGGQGKSFSQIRNIPESFLALDDIETGLGNRIPLWLFGFLY